MARVTRAERAWVLRVSLLLALTLTIPYLIAYWAEGSRWVFSGFLFAVEDGNSYLAKMMQGSAGAWLFRSPYTTVDQAGVAAFLPYLLLGKLASGAALHLQLVALFHLFRVAGIIIVAWGTYHLSTWFLPEVQDRRWVTAVALLGGGLGWLIAVLVPPGRWLGSLPLDFISPESFGFLAVFGLPHLAVARGMGFLAIASYLQARKGSLWGWRAGLFLLASALFQPLTAVTLSLLISAHQLALAGKYIFRVDAKRWLRQLKAAAGAAAVVSPYLVYLIVRFRIDPYLQAWTQQNRILSPHFAHYVVAYLILLPAAVAGVIALVRRGADRDLLPVAWILIFPALAYAPHPVQRRLPEGVWAALAIAAAVGIRVWFRKESGRRLARGALLAAVLPTSVVLVLGAGSLAAAPREPVFLPVEQVQAMSWLSSQAPTGATVLGSYQTSNAVPAYAPVQVPIGHGPESANLAQIRDQVGQLLRGEFTSAQADAFLMSHGVDYLLIGPREANLSGNQRPPYPDLWDARYSRSGWEIYSYRASSQEAEE